ncbi:3-demethylubiquinone-9 3-O-methyltransferase [Cyanobacteria bacterium FACHB-471]|nr:3-demethylubiquinone-9 3-O-methyltransferase [Cyanobacteria bacterium FACHB-471]
MKKNDLEYYDLNAEKWWKNGETLHLSNHFNQTRFEFAASYIPNWKNLKVLDIGCGGGLACEALAKLGAEVSGIDLSENSIKVAKEHASQSQLEIDYQRGSAEVLPYSSHTFDVVLCFDVLEHVSNLEKVLSEVHRVLSQGGVFLFDTINRTFKSKLVMIWLLEDVLNQIPRGLHDWNKFIKPDELNLMLREKHFSNIEVKGFDVTNGMNFGVLKDILLKGLSTRSEGGEADLFKIQINRDTSMCYIGKADKLL